MIGFLAFLVLPKPALVLEHLKEVPFTQVRIEDKFWAPRQKTNREVSVKTSLDMLEKVGDIRNFELAAERKTEGWQGLVFIDSDTYKVLEAASFCLALNRDPELEKRVDYVIGKLAAAQQPDGYLDTYYQVKEPGKRWTNLEDNHELYCAGHMFEAAVAHYQATGKKTFLNVATKYADLLCNTFGDEPGKRAGYCGHPEVELALYKLYRATSQKRYLDLADFFLKHRGEHFFAKEHHTPEDRYDGTYWLDDVPITEHRKIKGHAVRAAYLMSGVVDVAGETNNQPMLDMVQRVWKNTDERNTYVTGGIGPSGSNEGFTEDFDLPNLTAYQETCASVAMAMWNHRLNLLYGDAKYADRVERALYNGVLAGVSLSGDRFFYVNPLASLGDHHRSPWFSCACCPPNVARTLAALGNYAYATDSTSLFVNLYIQGHATAELGNGKKIEWNVTTNYPWDGKVKMTLATPGEYDIDLRVPEWAGTAKASVNGQGVKPSMDKGYMVVSRTWKSGDTIELDIPMEARRVSADPRVEADRGLLAYARGPLVYCLEAVDQTAPLSNMWVPADTKLSSTWKGDLLGGVTILNGEAKVQEGKWAGGLYKPSATARTVAFTAVPYYAWDNRKPGPMEVWMPMSPPPPTVSTIEGDARVTISFPNSGYAKPYGINDGIQPKSSGEQPAALCHWWPHKGTTEWAQYDWEKPVSLNASSVYWFDDTGRGECRIPSSWRILYKSGNDWVPVKLTSDSYPVKLDRWCRVEFEPVKTTALRLEFKMKDGWAAGVHEWKVEAPE